jgi:hypothetical protein
MARRLEYHRLDVYTKLTRVLRKLDEEIASLSVRKVPCKATIRGTGGFHGR